MVSEAKYLQVGRCQAEVRDKQGGHYRQCMHSCKCSYHKCAQSDCKGLRAHTAHDNSIKIFPSAEHTPRWQPKASAPAPIVARQPSRGRGHSARDRVAAEPSDRHTDQDHNRRRLPHRLVDDSGDHEIPKQRRNHRTHNNAEPVVAEMRPLPAMRRV